MSQRVRRARQLHSEGYRPTDLARALGISRQAIYGVVPRVHNAGGRRHSDDPVLGQAIVAVCARHSRYGTRRVRALLRREGWHVNRKRVQRIMRDRGLLIPPGRPHPKGEGVPFTVTGPDQLWQTDLTKFWAGPQDGWAYVTAVVDCYTREVVGHAVTRRCRTADTLLALDAAVQCRFPGDSDVRRAGLHLRRDNGSQFTSSAYVKCLLSLGITGELTHFRHPDGNAFVERFFGALKDEEIWCSDYPSFGAAKEAIDRYIDHYNTERPHSALGYRTPAEARAAYDPSLKTGVA